jgi:hypothetical protein
VLALLLATLVAGIARPAPAQAWEPDVNGCGSASGISQYLVPNAPLGYDFTSACNGHDYCYGVGLDKTFCDGQFLTNAKAVCNGGFVCGGLAYFYYFMISIFGQQPYDQSAQEMRDQLMNDLRACNGNSDCEQNVTRAWELDRLMNRLRACQDDSVCEHQVAQSTAFVGDPGPLDPDSGIPEDEMPPDECDFGLDIQAPADAGC